MMGNTDLNSAFSKARRFIALLAAFALSFSLLGTASIEAFAASDTNTQAEDHVNVADASSSNPQPHAVRGTFDGIQEDEVDDSLSRTDISEDDIFWTVYSQGDYSTLAVSELDYDKVYGVHGGYALMEKLVNETVKSYEDESDGTYTEYTYRLDVVRQSDGVVTCGTEYTTHETFYNSTLHGLINAFDAGFLPVKNEEEQYIVDLDGKDILNGVRFDSLTWSVEDDCTYFVGKNYTESATSFAVYRMVDGTMECLGTLDIALGDVGKEHDVSNVSVFSAYGNETGYYLWLELCDDNWVLVEQRYYRIADGQAHEIDSWTSQYDLSNEAFSENVKWYNGTTGRFYRDGNDLKYSYCGGQGRTLYTAVDASEFAELDRNFRYGPSSLLIQIGNTYFDERGTSLSWTGEYIPVGKLDDTADRYLAYTLYEKVDEYGFPTIERHWKIIGRTVSESVNTKDFDSFSSAYYLVCGGLIFSQNPYDKVYDKNGTLLKSSEDADHFHTPMCEGYGLFRLIDNSYWGSGNVIKPECMFYYDGSGFYEVSAESWVRALGKSPIDGEMLFAVCDEKSNCKIVDKQMKPVSYDIGYQPSLCTSYELGEMTAYYPYDKVLRCQNSLFHTSSAYNLIYVSNNGKYGAIDKNGNVVVPIEYDAYFDANAEDSNDTILVKKDGKWSFLKLGETENPSEQPSDDPTSNQPGEEPGDQPGEQPGTDPSGEQPGEQPGDQTDTQTPEPAITTQTMFRLYNSNSGEHFYTANAGEKNNLVSLGWNDEGTGWIAPATGDPVYRLYNPNAGEHHYTTNAAEKNMLVNAGWSYEGVGWYSGGDVRLYREYNPNAYANNHNYTTNKGEHDWLLSLGWRDEGYAWNAVSAK